jgi:hypothetical protein
VECNGRPQLPLARLEQAEVAVGRADHVAHGNFDVGLVGHCTRVDLRCGRVERVAHRHVAALRLRWID